MVATLTVGKSPNPTGHTYHLVDLTTEKYALERQCARVTPTYVFWPLWVCGSDVHTAACRSSVAEIAAPSL